MNQQRNPVGEPKADGLDADFACDIAIVGGGLAGASLAIALAPLGYTVKVIEAVAFKAAVQPSYDDRTLALSHSSCQILAGMGLWQALAPHATAIRKIHVSEYAAPGEVQLDADELGLSEFGFVVEARRFGATATAALQGLDNIEILCPAKVTGLKVQQGVAQLSLSTETGERVLEARLVVAADGANSFIRQHLNIPTRSKDYRQTAVICNITPEVAHEGRAFECLTATGPFALLPHTGTRCGLIWSVASDAAAELLALDDSEFLARAQQRFGHSMGAFLKAGKRTAYPLNLVRAERDIDDHLVIMGNASHAIHPVGAQGFNLALRDVAVLAEVLADHDQGDPGDRELLQRYSAWRQPDQRSTVAMSDALARVFSHPSVLLGGLRTSGFAALSLFPGLRRRMAIQFMGYRGKTPRLALGEPLRTK